MKRTEAAKEAQRVDRKRQALITRKSAHKRWRRYVEIRSLQSPTASEIRELGLLRDCGCTIEEPPVFTPSQQRELEALNEQFRRAHSALMASTQRERDLQSDIRAAIAGKTDEELLAILSEIQGGGRSG